jgi:hypothetical protein
MRHIQRIMAAMLTAGALCFAASGCSWFRREPEDPFAAAQRTAGGVVQAGYDEPGRQVVTTGAQVEEPTGWDRFTAENLKKSFKKAVGKGPNEPIARERFREGEELYAAKDYAAAAKKFTEAADRCPIPRSKKTPCSCRPKACSSPTATRKPATFTAS